MKATIRVENVAGGGGMVGALQISKAAPDGLTLGMINAPGLLVSSLTGETKAPNPVNDFSILGRVVRSRQIWVTAGSSPLKTMDMVLNESRRKPILFAISDVGGTSFLNVVVGSHLLKMRHDLVAGYPGSRESSLAVLRGEVDIMSIPFESALDRIEAGELRPILQIASERISPHSSLDNAAIFGGKRGLVARRAKETGRNVDDAVEDTQTLVGLIGAGSLIVAPLGLKDDVLQCIREAIYATLTDSEFEAAAAKAKRSLNVARGREARADIIASAEKAEDFVPIVKNAIERIRR
jgi:tripartite-type tricarboxylate transporter receptor subunit TctC